MDLARDKYGIRAESLRWWGKESEKFYDTNLYIVHARKITP